MTTTSTHGHAPSSAHVGPRAGGAQRRPHLIGRRSYPLFLLVLAGALVFMVLLAVSIGSVSLPLRTVWGVMADHLLWFRHGHSADRIDDAIIWKFRAPRALLAVVVGAGLAVAGTVLQAIVRNPLAEIVAALRALRGQGRGAGHGTHHLPRLQWRGRDPAGAIHGCARQLPAQCAGTGQLVSLL